MESSSLPTLKQIGRVVPSKLPRLNAKPELIDWGIGGSPAALRFADGSSTVGSCIRCPDAPCMEYSDAELAYRPLPSFPGDLMKKVCPTDAISWPLTATAPTIEQSLCVSCGLCVSRCPVAAIHVTDQGAVVNDQPNQVFRIQKEPTTLEKVNAVSHLFKGAKRRGSLLTESGERLTLILERVERIAGSSDSQMPNVLSRNLLMEVGVTSVIRRRGDNNVRMDMLLGPPGVQYGTGEVEFGYAGILDAPRNLLDNIAVLCSRYGFDKAQTVALVIASALPNQRSEYWQLASDIAEVVGVRIGSITWAALLVFVWEGVKLQVSPANEFYSDSSSRSIRSAIEEVIERPLDCPLGLGGFFESKK